MFFKRGKKRVSTVYLTLGQWMAFIDVVLSLLYIFDASIFGLMDYLFLGLDPLTFLYIATALVYLMILIDYYVY